MARPNLQTQKLETRKQEFENKIKTYPPKLQVYKHFDVSEKTLDRFMKKHYAMNYDDLRDYFQIQKLESKKSEFEIIMQFYVRKTEVAGAFSVPERLLDRFISSHYEMTFEDLRESKFGKTAIAIRQKQIEKALAGDSKMLIWVGKQLLGQTDKVEKVNSISPSEIKDIKPYWDDENGTTPSHAASNSSSTTNQ